MDILLFKQMSSTIVPLVYAVENWAGITPDNFAICPQLKKKKYSVSETWVDTLSFTGQLKFVIWNIWSTPSPLFWENYINNDSLQQQWDIFVAQM